MIKFRHTFLGVLAAAAVMIPFYVALWLVDIGGLAGMMNDDSYPVSIVIVPLMAALFSGVAFWVGVYPVARLVCWLANEKGMSRWRAAWIGSGLSAVLGGGFGLLAGGTGSGFYYAAFMGLAALAFWWTTTRNMAEPSAGGNAATPRASA